MSDHHVHYSPTLTLKFHLPLSSFSFQLCLNVMVIAVIVILIMINALSHLFIAFVHALMARKHQASTRIQRPSPASVETEEEWELDIILECMDFKRSEIK